MATLGDRFRVFIVNTGFTPEEFGKKVGVGKSTIYNIIRGDTKKITQALAEKINDAFPEFSVVHILELNNSNVSKITFSIKGVEIGLDEIITFIANNEEAFLNQKYFSNLIDLKVTKKLNLLLRNPDKLDDFLSS